MQTTYYTIVDRTTLVLSWRDVRARYHGDPSIGQLQLTVAYFPSIGDLWLEISTSTLSDIEVSSLRFSNVEICKAKALVSKNFQSESSLIWKFWEQEFANLRSENFHSGNFQIITFAKFSNFLLNCAN